MPTYRRSRRSLDVADQTRSPSLLAVDGHFLPAANSFFRFFAGQPVRNETAALSQPITPTYWRKPGTFPSGWCVCSIGGSLK